MSSRKRKQVEPRKVLPKSPKTNSQIITGSCLEELKELPDNSVDLVITSPPYNKSSNSHAGQEIGINTNVSVSYNVFVDKLPQDQYEKEQIEILNELYRIVKPGGSCFYNHKVQYVKKQCVHPITWVSQSVWNVRQEIVWNKLANPNVSKYRYYQRDERIYWLYKEDKQKQAFELDSDTATFGSIWHIPSSKPVYKHPATFPLCIPLLIICSMKLKENSVILDPYAGTGTTLKAAQLLGYNSLGIEIDPHYTQMIEERLSESNTEAAEQDDKFFKAFHEMLKNPPKVDHCYKTQTEK